MVAKEQTGIFPITISSVTNEAQVISFSLHVCSNLWQEWSIIDPGPRLITIDHFYEKRTSACFFKISKYIYSLEV